MAQNDEKPAGHHPHGPSNFDQRCVDQVENKPAPGEVQFPIVIARIQKNADEEIRVAIAEFKGHHLVDIRIFVDFTAARVPMPTKRGLSIRIGQLPDLLDALQDAAARARKLGMLNEAG